MTASSCKEAYSSRTKGIWGSKILKPYPMGEGRKKIRDLVFRGRKDCLRIFYLPRKAAGGLKKIEMETKGN